MYIKELRQKRQLSQENLAERCGLSLRTIQRVECGNRVGYASMRALAVELKVDVEILEQEINEVEPTSNEYKNLPLWLRLFMGGGWIAGNRPAYKRLEIFFITIGVIILAFWMGNLVWEYSPQISHEVFLLGIFSMLVGAYSQSIGIRLGDKYDVWSRLEETMPQKGIFGINQKGE